MANILSQDEIDALLGVVDTDDAEAEQVAGSGASGAESLKTVPAYLPYDFRRPNRVSKEQLRYFQTIHEAFTRQFANSLGSYLRAMVDIEIVSADQLTYGEYVLSLPASTALFVFDLKPLEGSGVLEMNPSLILLMVERIFGGSGVGAGLSRDLTAIETAVVTKLVKQGLETLGNSWDRIAPLRPSFSELMKNPQMLQLLPTTETVILITFELRLGDQNGILSLCYPYLSMEPILPNMSSRGALLGQKVRRAEKGREWIERRLSDSYLTLSAVLGRTDLKVAEFIRLQPGDVIKLDRRVNEPVDVVVGGEWMGRARPGLRGRNRAVRLDAALRRGELPDES